MKDFKKSAQLEKMAEKLKELKDKVMSEKYEAEDKLKELEKSFPRLLATHVLGQVTNDEVNKAVKEMDDLKLVITRTPLTVQGLEELERENNAEIH